MDHPKPRGRKRKTTEVVDTATPTPPPTETVLENVHIVVEELPAPPSEEGDGKKRGRKPKGGKLISKLLDPSFVSPSVANVILHLKCSLIELDEYIVQQNKQIIDPLQYNPEIPPDIVSFDRNPDTFASYEDTTTTNTNTNSAVVSNDSPAQTTTRSTTSMTTTTTTTTTPTPGGGGEPLSTEHAQKMKKLKVSLYKMTCANQKAACFWCTCDFDNDACFIPRAMDSTMIHAYGSFCRPECAVGYLMNENLDDSTKFERYHLLNQVYGAMLGYKSNIKPAPNPHYILDKFYGNMTIQEYRKLLRSDHLLYTLDKPMTRILPELHEVTDDFVLGIYGGSNKGTGATQAGGVYKVKRQSEKQQGPSKASIIRGKFGMTQT
jgi:hypothetical protein